MPIAAAATASRGRQHHNSHRNKGNDGGVALRTIDESLIQCGFAADAVAGDETNGDNGIAEGRDHAHDIGDTGREIEDAETFRFQEPRQQDLRAKAGAEPDDARRHQQSGRREQPAENAGARRNLGADRGLQGSTHQRRKLPISERALRASGQIDGLRLMNRLRPRAALAAKATDHPSKVRGAA
jgi:hypothetical protein